MVRFMISLMILNSLPAYGLGDPVYMELLIDRALAEHPSLSAISSSSKAAGEMISKSNYIPDPVLKVNYFQSPIETRNGPQQYSIMLSQPIPWPAVLAAKKDQARIKRDFAARKLEAKKLELSLGVRSAVFALIGLKSMRSIEIDIRSALSSFREVVLARIQVGQAGQADVAKIDVEIASVAQELVDLNLQIKLASNRLVYLTGSSSDIDSIPENFPDNYLAATKLNDLESILTAHPSYQMALSDVKRQEARRAEERSQYLPKIAANLSWFGIEQADSLAMTKDSGKDAMSVGLTVSVPIWTGMSSRVSRENYLVGAKQKNSQGVALSLKRKVEDLRELLQSSQDALVIYQHDMLPKLRNTLEIEQENYSQGRVSIDRVLAHYTRLLRFETRLVKTKQTIAVANAKLVSLGIPLGGSL